jgi:hypothetical protein
VVQDIGKKNRFERRITEREILPIEQFDWNVGAFPRQHVYSANCEVASLGIDCGREKSVAASHIKNTCILRRELTEPRR